MTDLKEEILNTKDKIVGEVKVAVGKATGNEDLELKGKLQSSKAEFREKVAEIKDDVTEKVNDVYDYVVDNDKNTDLEKTDFEDGNK